MSRQSTEPPPRPKTALAVEHRAILARRLDQLADHNLHLGFHLAAEQLAHEAAKLREARV